LGSDELIIEYFDAPTPAKPQQAALDDDHRISTSNGGLVLARAGEHRVAIVLPPHISGGLESLKKLSVRPTLQTGPRSAGSIKRMIELAETWTKIGVPADDNAARLQSQVNDAVVARLSGMIAGSRWWDLEHELLDGRRATNQRLLDAAGDSSDERRAAGRLLDLSTRVGRDPPARLTAFSEALSERTLQVTADRAEPILRLSTVPGSLAVDDDPAVDRAIEDVLQRPALHRLARLFVVALAGLQTGSDGSVLRTWPWD
jgi:hypothetical protein